MCVSRHRVWAINAIWNKNLCIFGLTYCGLSATWNAGHSILTDFKMRMFTNCWLKPILIRSQKIKVLALRPALVWRSTLRCLNCRWTGNQLAYCCGHSVRLCSALWFEVTKFRVRQGVFTRIGITEVLALAMIIFAVTAFQGAFTSKFI